MLKAASTLPGNYGSALAVNAATGHWAAANPVQVVVGQRSDVLYSASLDTLHPGSARFSTDGRWLYIGTEVLDVQGQSFETLSPVEEMLTVGLSDANPELFSVYGSAWGPDGSDLVVCAEYRPPRGIGARSEYQGPSQRLLLLDGHARTHRATLWVGDEPNIPGIIAVSGEYIGAGGMPVRVWQRHSFSLAAQLSAHTTTVRGLAFSEDGSLLASAAWDGMVAVWNTLTWQPVAQWNAHSGGAHAVCLHPTQLIAVTGGQDGQIKVWAVDEMPRLLDTVSADSPVLGLAMDGSRLLAATDRGTLMLFDL